MILSADALLLKGIGDKLVKEFLSTHESATSWLDVCEPGLYMRLAESRTRMQGTV